MSWIASLDQRDEEDCWWGRWKQREDIRHLKMKGIKGRARGSGVAGASDVFRREQPQALTSLLRSYVWSVSHIFRRRRVRERQRGESVSRTSSLGGTSLLPVVARPPRSTLLPDSPTPSNFNSVNGEVKSWPNSSLQCSARKWSLTNDTTVSRMIVELTTVEVDRKIWQRWESPCRWRRESSSFQTMERERERFRFAGILWDKISRKS